MVIGEVNKRQEEARGKDDFLLPSSCPGAFSPYGK